MSFYPTEINKHFQQPENAGKADGANAVGTGATFACGAVLRFTLQIEPETKKILDAKFKTNGCGYLIASADALAEKIVGRKLTELHRLDKETLEKEIELGKFSASRKHCGELALETLQSAFAAFRRARIEEWAGEKALICTCFGVSEELIENLIKEKSLETVEEVTGACRAGGGCGSCQPLIEDILDVYRREKL